MINNFAIGVYEKAFPEETSLEEMFFLSKEAGYDFFELSIDRSEKRIERVYNDDFIIKIRKIIEKYDMPVGSLCLSALSTHTLGNINDEISERALDILKHTIVFATKVGARIVQIPACDMPKYEVRNEETDNRYFKNIVKAVEFASAHGVILGLENMENDYMNNTRKCMRLVNCVNSPYCQLYLDSGNITAAALSDESYYEDMELSKGHLISFHLKEVRPGKYGGLFYGEGCVNFALLTKYALEFGARRFVLEYWYTGNPSWKNDLLIARNLGLNWIKEALYGED